MKQNNFLPLLLLKTKNCSILRIRLKSIALLMILKNIQKLKKITDLRKIGLAQSKNVRKA